ncbi:hypothetical protein G6F56_010665 [Rhizopus delemar]|nr:hypothetical protein G6F56_010665 [Rhizopus delemar]
MIQAENYSNSMYEIPYKEQRPSIVENRTLYPLYPTDISDSRRASFTDPTRRHHSPPYSPLSSRRSSIIATPPEGVLLPPSLWRRESLPSISHLTSVMSEEDDRRHSITAISKRRTSEAPYFRSPELRMNHKLAERKRRKEMKDLFDDLRGLLPFEKGIKTSKWEILSKTLDHIKTLQEKEIHMEKEKIDLLNELNSLRK